MVQSTDTHLFEPLWMQNAHMSIPTRWLGIWDCSGRVALVSINVGFHPLKDMEDVSHLLCSFFSPLFPLASCLCSNFLVGNWPGNLLTLPGPEISTRLSWNLGQLSALHWARVVPHAPFQTNVMQCLSPETVKPYKLQIFQWRLQRQNKDTILQQFVSLR